jgi:hypothetical protein
MSEPLPVFMRADGTGNIETRGVDDDEERPHGSLDRITGGESAGSHQPSEEALAINNSGLP